MLSEALKTRVIDKVTETLKKIEALYNLKIPTPVIKFNINSGRLAGQACWEAGKEYVIRFNPVFLEYYTEEFLNTTVPHEVAHIGIFEVYKEQRLQVTAHGPEWKKLMLQIGADPARCHKYSVPEGVTAGKLKEKYSYVCQRCGSPVPVGPGIHSKIQKGKRYIHTGCGGKLVGTGDILGRVDFNTARKKILSKGALQPKQVHI